MSASNHNLSSFITTIKLLNLENSFMFEIIFFFVSKNCYEYVLHAFRITLAFVSQYENIRVPKK